ncbi:hypothetical protein COE78_30510, partial [Bacillus pseudomycoides]
KAAKRFFKKALQSFHISEPRVVTVDKNVSVKVCPEGFLARKGVKKNARNSCFVRDEGRPLEIGIQVQVS